MRPTICPRFSVVVFSQAVVLIEVANAAEQVRMKFEIPAADAISWGCTEDSVRPMVGTKKNGIPTPWMRNGRAMDQKLASAMKCARQNEIMAIQQTPNE